MRTGRSASRNHSALLALVAVLALSPSSHAADAMRCPHGIVDTGDTRADILAACGEPAFRDVWPEPVWPGGFGAAGNEEWFYNWGPNLLLRVLLLRDGKLADIGSDGYGFNAAPVRACGPNDFLEGLSKYRLLARCGPPLTQDALGVFTPLRTRDGRVIQHYFQAVYRERWTYNLGPNYLMPVVTLENGRVTDVDSGSRGFAPR